MLRRGLRSARQVQVMEPRSEFFYFVPDGVRPWPDQTVEWVLRYTAGLYGSTRTRVGFALAGSGRARRRSDNVDYVIGQLSLDALRGERLRGLSKGEMRRVLTAMGLLARRVLLLDEPFDGLDLRQTREMMGVLRTGLKPCTRSAASRGACNRVHTMLPARHKSSSQAGS